MTGQDAASPRKRNPALVTVDIVAAILLVLACLGLGLTALGWGTAFLALPAAAGAGYALIAVAVLAFFLTTGLVVVNLIRRRYTFWWPLAGAIVILAAIYITSAIAGAAAGA